MSSEMISTSNANELAFRQSETPGLNNQNLNELAQALVEFKFSANAVEDTQSQQLRRLRRQVMWLQGGLAIALICLGGLGVWSIISMRDVQTRLAERSQQRQTESTPERLLKLETQVNALTSRAAENQKNLTGIKGNLDTIQADLNQRQRAIVVLSKSLQELVGETTPATTGSNLPTPTNSSTPSNSPTPSNLPTPAAPNSR
ncbi:MAG: hypothetical protein WBG73_10660 [Coleofasciculaceae cyanobacterium]